MKKYIIILISVFFIVACSEKVDLEGEKVDYEELQSMIIQKEKELQKVTNQLSNVENEYDELQELSKNEDKIKERVIKYEMEEIELEKLKTNLM